MNKKSLLFKMLALVVCLSCALGANAYDFKYGSIYYNITGVNTVEVTNNGNGSYNGNVSIPSTVSNYGKTYQVTAIGNLAFNECFGLKSVTIPSSVTTIGTDAFHYCSAMTSVNIPNAVTSIGVRAFFFCQSLTSMSIPNSVRTIGSSAFCGCNNLASISLGNQLNTIGDNAFQDCYSLTSITLPKSVISIGDTPFLGCNSLAMIKVENGNSVYDSRNNCNAVIQTSSNMLVCGCKTTVIPNTVTSIGGGAFAFIETLSEIVIPNSVTEIGVSAFYYCSDLERVTIGKSVTNIDMQAFCSCWALTDIICLAATPPSLDLTTFDEDIYEQATLTVSAFSLNAYETADYWKNFTTINGFLQGDLNGDGVVDVTDVTLLIDAVLNSTPVNRGAADMNSDGVVDVTDVTALINRVLNGGMDPYDPHSTGRWLVLFDKNGNKSWLQLWSNPDGGYFTAVSLTTATYGTGRAKFYIVDEGVAYGASQANKSMVLGSYTSNPLTAGQNCYTVPAGYTYTIGMVYNSSDKRYAVAQQGPACN